MLKTRQVEGVEHQRTLMVMNNLGLIYAHRRRYDDATSLLREAMRISRRAIGENHPLTAGIILSLSEVMALRGRGDEALTLLEEAVEHGYRDANQIASDEDLKSLRGHRRFDAILAGLRKAPGGKD